MQCIEDQMFIGYSENTIKRLCEFLQYLEDDIVLVMVEKEIHHTLISAFINIFHITILLRKQMRSSSIYLIMAMIAVMDICSLSYVIDRESIRYIQTIFLCYSKNTDYILMVSQIATDYIRNYGRRCSTWLSLSITTLRALVIRYPMNTRIGKLSNPKAAFYIIIGVILTIIPINIIDAFRLKVSLENESFGCGFGFGPRYYSVDWTDSYLSDSYFVRAMSKRIDGLVSKIIPCCLFPLVTFVLVHEIRKANARRMVMASTVAAKNHRSTSYLVLAQTLIFFIAEFPLGSVLFVQSLLYATSLTNARGEYKILESLNIFFEFILSASTMCHMIICMLMSSQYRMNALMFVRAGHPLKEKKAEVTVTGTQHI